MLANKENFIRVMKTTTEIYETIMQDAKEDILLMAVRREMDTRLINVEFDADRDPGPHLEHTLRISVRNSDIYVSHDNIPHEWLPVSTG